MVKIQNVSGDIKSGTQAEAVYLVRHGQQIRRTRKTKRTVISDAQEKHRQLYRAALAWRKSLSLANRRYLNDYCKPNVIIDSYGIPLHWSRFALKIYLQAVKFVIISNPKNPLYSPPEPLIEEQVIWRGGLALLAGYRVRAGQRLIIPNRKVIKLAFQLRKHGNPLGDIYFRVRKLDDTILLEKLWGDASELSTSYAWQEVEFPNPFFIDEEVRIIVEFAGGDSSNVIYALFMNANVKPEEYWTIYRPALGWHDGTNYDFTYRYFYYQETEELTATEGENPTPRLLCINHPALLGAIQYRNGKDIAQWTNLSSLDEQYLTAQLRLEVESGDLIKATSLPGIEYTYRVV